MEGLNHQGKVDSVYSKVQVVHIKSRDGEERRRELRVTIELLTGGGLLGKQTLSVRLTDDQDAYFLYSLLVTEDDFKGLKQEQGLLVDFVHFPAQLVRLLDECMTASDKPSARFHLMLNEESSQQPSLQFIETNEFKRLCHLSLRVLTGNDSELKRHMAINIKQLKSELESTARLLEQRGQQLNFAEQQLSVRQRELEELRMREAETRGDLEKRLLQEASDAREALAKAHSEWQHRSERERQEADEAKTRDMSSLEQQVSELKLRNQLLAEKLLHSEASVRELAKHADSTEKELQVSKKEVSSLRKQNAQIDTEYHGKEKSLQVLKTRVAVLEQEMKDKELLNSKTQELLQLANQNKASIEETLVKTEAALEKERAASKRIADDLMKANEILVKQYSDIRGLQNKIQARSEQDQKTQALLESRERASAEGAMQLEQAQSRVYQLMEQIKDLEGKLAQAKSDIEAKEKTLQTRDAYIALLSKRDTENKYLAASRPRLLAPFLSSPSTIGVTSTPQAPLTNTVEPASDAEAFLRQQRENILNGSNLRQRLGLNEVGNTGTAQPATGTLRKTLPLQQELHRKISPQNAPKPAVSRPGLGRPRPEPTSTTPAVSRGDICSAYFRS